MISVRALAAMTITVVVACSPQERAAEGSAGQAAEAAGGMASVKDDKSMPDIVKVAVGSADHTTLVAAIQAAGLVDVLANPGPFTVFAPTNAAFEKLPAGTVEDLLKPENKAKLVEVLQHHVTTSALNIDFFQDGQSLGMVSAGPETIHKKDGETWIGDAKVIASVRASNGWVHVIDAVLVPAAK